MLALACALATNAGLLIRHRGAVAAPDVDGRHPLRSARGLFASKWWTIGWFGFDFTVSRARYPTLFWLGVLILAVTFAVVLALFTTIVVINLKGS